MRRTLLATSGVVALLWTAPGAAQQTAVPQVGQVPGQAGVAEQCLSDLQAFTNELAYSGYGVVGPPGYGVGAPTGGWYGARGGG